jgi:hypothetical protein
VGWRADARAGRRKKKKLLQLNQASSSAQVAGDMCPKILPIFVQKYCRSLLNPPVRDGQHELGKIPWNFA